MSQTLSDNVDFLVELHDLPKTLDKQTGEWAVSQKTIEKHTGVAQTTLSGILEQGKIPRLSTLERIADGFGIHVWQLIAPTELLKASLASDQVADLLKNFSASSPSGRAAVCDVARLYAGQSDD
jgi:transcriptional regulator with XRE-family HTH domain